MQPIQKNKRICEECGATYVINGDESEYWCQLTEEGVKVEGKCEFHRPNSKYYINNENK